MKVEESSLVKWLLREEHKRNWFVIMLFNPSLYLFTLMKKVIYMGIVLLIFYEILTRLSITQQLIPSTFHSVIGLVIGLLLVFRTNTAYDRWWEARKVFSSFHSSILYMKLKTQNDATSTLLKELSESFFSHASYHGDSSLEKLNFMEIIKKLSIEITKEKFTTQVSSMFERKIVDVLENLCTIERIKNTPIPLSYSLHIKISVMAYIFTLPLGLFFAMGIWTVPLVMLIYFIIGGIEIISNEIENPFKGDPNDLPIEIFKKQNEAHL